MPDNPLWSTDRGTVLDVPLLTVCTCGAWREPDERCECELPPTAVFGFGSGRAYEVPIDPASLTDCESCQ